MQQIIPLPVNVPAQQSARTEAPSATGSEGHFSEHLTRAADTNDVQRTESRKADRTTTDPAGQKAGQAPPLDGDDQFAQEISREVDGNTEEHVPQVNGSDFPTPDSETPQVLAVQDGSILLAGATQALDDKQTISRILNSITDPNQIDNGKEVQKASITTEALTRGAAEQTLAGETANNRPSGAQANLEQLFQNQSIKNSLANGNDGTVRTEKSNTGQAPVGSGSLFTPVQIESNTTAQQSVILPNSSQLQAQAGSPAGSQGSSTVTIENWSATFGADGNKQVQPLEVQQGHQRAENKENGVPIGIFQNDKGQVITVTQLEDGAQQRSRAFSSGTPTTTDGSAQRQDINSNFMHSNLPNGSVKTDQPNGQSQQQAGNGAPQQQPDKSIPVEQLLTKEPLNDKEPPLIFSLDQVNAPATKTAAQMPLTASLFRMPSGLQVPDGAPMDQVINQLANGRKLETGTVTLKLHPQELGELRMEIRVEQDNIKAHITTQNPQAQEMLDRHLPRLRESLEQQGLRLDQIEITVADKSNDDRQLFQNNPGQHQPNRPKANHLQAPIHSLSAEEEPEELPEPHQSLSVLA